MPPDTTPPDTTITSGPTALTNQSSASFTFVSSEPGTFQCQLDGGGFIICSSPKAYAGLADGSHTFQVRAIDAAGNVDPSPASSTWTVDTTPPNTSITSAADGNGASVATGGSTVSSSITFAFAGSDAVGVASFECKLDEAAFAACTSLKSYSGLAVSSHTFQVRAIDTAGHTDPTPASRSWSVVTPAQAVQNVIASIDSTFVLAIVLATTAATLLK